MNKFQIIVKVKKTKKFIKLKINNYKMAKTQIINKNYQINLNKIK